MRSRCCYCRIGYLSTLVFPALLGQTKQTLKIKKNETLSTIHALFWKQMQAESETTPSSAAPTPSYQVIPQTIQEGFEKMVVQAGAGFVLGGMAGIVLARGGATGARRVMAGFGAGVGFGSAWTRTSMDIDDVLALVKK